MASTDFVLSADVAEFDDLPRTLRREREAREREKRDRETRDKKLATPSGRDDRKASFEAGPSLYAQRDADPATRSEFAARDDDNLEYPAATIKRFDVPFFHMMRFYLKGVVAAIPALILLTAICWGMGQLMKIFFPWLLKAQILIQFPN